MTLTEVRRQWELGGDGILCLTHNDPIGSDCVYKTVYVIFRYRQAGTDMFDLIRYFPIEGINWEGDWMVSKDVSGKSLEFCLAVLTSKFKDLYPVHSCKRCGSDLKDGFCSDETCPYSDWSQNVPNELFSMDLAGMDIFEACNNREITVQHRIWT